MSRPQFRRISAQEAAALFAKDGVRILDCRQAPDYGKGHIQGAQHLTMSSISSVMGSTPKAAPVVIYCYKGNASQEYARMFSDFRYEEVYSVDGGFEALSKL